MARKHEEELEELPQPKAKPSPRWFAPVMVTFFVVGLIWTIASYVTSVQFPIPGLGNGNLFIGLGIILVGFVMTMFWRS